MTVMGDALMDELSDAGSIPARSMTDKSCSLYNCSFFVYITHIECYLPLNYTRKKWYTNRNAREEKENGNNKLMENIF